LIPDIMRKYLFLVSLLFQIFERSVLTVIYEIFVVLIF
jgi:hypothetical protein